MAVDVTPEVASANKNLEELCEKFETSVNELCTSSFQSIHPHEFYEHKSVSIAAECVDAFSKFQSACSYEVTAYEDTVAEADDVLRQQKRRFEEDAAQRTKAYEDTVAEADDVLRQQERRFEEDAAQRTRAYEDTIAEADYVLHELKSELEFNANQRIQDIEYEVQEVGVDINFSQEKTTMKSTSKIPYDVALERVKRELESEASSNVAFYTLKDWGPLIGSLLVLFWPIGGCALWGYRNYRADTNDMFFVQSFKDAFFFFVIVPMIVLIIYSFWKRGRKPEALRALSSAAVAERDSIWEGVEKEFTNASAERDRIVKNVQEKKERKDKQAAEEGMEAISSAEKYRNAKVKEAREKKEREEGLAAETEMRMLAERDKKVKDARSRRDLALAYIVQEYQAYDSRLCQCLDKFQSLVETWTIENAGVTSILNENRVQNFREDGEQIVSRMTRVGTVGF